MSPSSADSFSGLSREFDWNLLHMFYVLAQSESVTAAAYRLQRQQPTVSNALKRLEDQLGWKLINRSGGRFELTAEGRALFDEAAEVFGIVSRMPARLQNTSEDIVGNVRIAMVTFGGCALLDDAISAFRRDHPLATFGINTMPSAAGIAQVLSNRSTMAVCLVRSRNDALSYTPLYREFYGFFCGRPHPLFGRKGLNPGDLSGHDAVGFLTDQFSDALRDVAVLRTRIGLSENIVARASNFEDLQRLIVSGVGIGAVPLHLAQPLVDRGELFQLPPYQDLPMVEVNVVHNPGARKNSAERAFVAALTERIDAIPIAERVFGNPSARP